MVTDEMMKRAVEAYAKDTGAEGFQLEGWIEPAIRAALEAALSAAKPQPAPSVAVMADLPERFEEWWTGRDSKGEKTLDYNQRKQLAWDAFYAAALSAQVLDVAMVTRESAIKAIDHVDANNGRGRKQEAITMLAAAPAKQEGRE